MRIGLRENIRYTLVYGIIIIVDRNLVFISLGFLVGILNNVCETSSLLKYLGNCESSEILLLICLLQCTFIRVWQEARYHIHLISTYSKHAS